MSGESAPLCSQLADLPRCPFSLGPPFSGSVDSILVRQLCCPSGPMLFLLLSRGQRPSQEEWWVVYIHWKWSSLVALMLFKNTFTSEGGGTNLIELGDAPVFPETCFNLCVAFASESGRRGLSTWSSGFVALEIGGSISRSEALFLTLETSTLGCKALTFMVKSHLSVPVMLCMLLPLLGSI